MQENLSIIELKKLLANFELKQPQPKQKWLTNDRKWNLIFWFVMSLGFSGILFMDDLLGFKMLNLFALIALVILLPMILTTFNPTSTDENDKFFNSDGEEIKAKNLPTVVAAFCAIGSFGLTIAMENEYLAGNALVTNFIFCVLLFSGFSMYFIIKNCPISLIFRRHWWSYIDKITPTSQRSYTSTSSRSFTKPARVHRSSGAHIYSAAYSGNSGNVYHRSRY